MSDLHSIVELLLHGIRLKQMPRTGWVQRGVPNAEDVAAHSYGVSLTVLALVDMIDRPFNLARVLAMAVLHDLPEAVVSDIPSPVKRFMRTPTDKGEIESAALREMTANVSFGADWRELWDEYRVEQSAEAKLVHDADKIDMYLQALTYEQQFGNRQLAQFWKKPASFHYPECQTLYSYLRASRAKT